MNHASKAALAVSVTALVFAASGVGFASTQTPSTSYKDITSSAAPVNPGTASTGWALCPRGYAASGGGAATTGDVVIMNDAPYAGISQGVHVAGWQAAVQNIGKRNGTMRVVAVCAS